ncbi:MAG: hypothetical protein FWD06_01105 [Oscillospiraceae bacterium]|nr:hypothetical protein [Oscillospiraceae bacterium]
MANSAEIIEKLSAKLEAYRMFATARGYDTDEQVMDDVKAMLQHFANDDNKA